MMKFKNLALATALIFGGIGGVSGNAVASTVTVSIEDEAPAAQTATFVGDVLSVNHDALGQNETASLQSATFPVGEAQPVGTDEPREQDAAVPFIHPVALPEPAVWDLMLIGFCSLGFFGFAGKRRLRRDSRRNSVPSLNA
jgi:hypothetical protein